MSIVRTIATNPDIYDALVDVYGIDLVEHTTIATVINEIDSNMVSLDALIDQRVNDEDKLSCEYREHIASLAMIKGFIAVLVYSEQRAND